MSAHPHTRPVAATTGSGGSGALAVADPAGGDPTAVHVAPIVPIRITESRRDRRRRRRQAERDGRGGLPELGAAPGEVTPTVLRLEARYQDEVHAVLHGAIRAAAPLWAQRCRLREWVDRGVHELGEEQARQAGRAACERGRSRGEEHLSEDELTERRRAEAARESARSEADLRNRRTVLAERRLALRRVDEALEALAERTRAHAEAVRAALVVELSDYVDELVRHHPDGHLLGRCSWPTRFAVPPDWVTDPAELRERLRTEGAAR